MANLDPLNDLQARVLRWISDDCPDGVMGDGYAHRVSATALRSRGLVTISGRGPTWTAEITDKGREQLAAIDRGEPTTPTRAPRRAKPANKVNASSKMRELVDDVVKAGGTLRLPASTGAKGVDYRQRAYAAQRFGHVPDGKRLVVARDGEYWVVSLKDGTTGNELGASEVPVPVRVRRYHRVARTFRDRTAIHEVSRRQLPRATRVVHALAVEIERRGHTIEVERPPSERSGDTRRRDATEDGHLRVTVNGHTYGLRLREHGVSSRGAWERVLAERKKALERPSPWSCIPDAPTAFDKNATGELELELTGYGRSQRQSRWGDRKRWKLEDRLAQALREIETRAEEDAQRRLERERQEQERQRQWEAAMQHARERFAEDYRIRVLDSQIARWEKGERIRAYCDAVESRHGSDVLADGAGSASWLAAAREQAEHLQSVPSPPEIPEATNEDLKPFLGGWSPYGPGRGPYGW